MFKFISIPTKQTDKQKTKQTNKNNVIATEIEEVQLKQECVKLIHHLKQEIKKKTNITHTRLQNELTC